jgi:hypothetical protein
MQAATGMTEAEWATCPEPQKMLAFLRGKASQRQLRLFAAFCARRAIRLLIEDHPDPDWVPSVHRSLAVVEHFLVGRATRDEVSDTDFGAYDRGDDPAAYAVSCAMEACRDEGEAVQEATEAASRYSIEAFVNDAWRKNPDRQSGAAFQPLEENVRAVEKAAHAAALRDIIGNPFRDVSAGPAPHSL